MAAHVHQASGKFGECLLVHMSLQLIFHFRYIFFVILLPTNYKIIMWYRTFSGGGDRKQTGFGVFHRRVLDLRIGRTNRNFNPFSRIISAGQTFWNSRLFSKFCFLYRHIYFSYHDVYYFTRYFYLFYLFRKGFPCEGSKIQVCFHL